MAMEQHRHDMSDRAWEKIRPYTIGEKGTRGGNARDTRQFINGVFWILRTGAPWRDLPETYGNWKNVHRRFCRWRDKGIWEKILEALVDDTDFEWLISTPAMSKYIPTPLARGVEIRRWAAQKGAQHQDTFGRGCAWYAGAILYQFWYHSGLRSCSATDCGIPGRVPSGRPGL